MNFIASTQVRWNYLLSSLGLLFVVLAWVLPNKNFPWLSAWNEGLAFLSVGILALVALKHGWGQSRSGSIALPVLIFTMLALLTVWLQWFFGLLIFRGDAWLITLYMGFFALSVQTAWCMTRGTPKNNWVDGLMAAIAMAGLLTVAMSLIQWTVTYDLAIFIQEVGRHGRPFANLGQINHVNTLCFIAGCAALQLHARGRIHGITLVIAIVILSFGMALTQSRTAVVQIIALLAWSIWQSRSLNPLRNTAMVFALAYIIWAIAIPYLAAVAHLEPGRSMQMEASASNLRLKAWAAMLDAIVQRPLLGYGWLQNGWAQQTVALEHPGLRYEFNYAHNFVVDLMIWVGLPLGIMMTAVLVGWAWHHAKSRNREITFLAGALLGIMTHGALEYPLAYAYFLMPAGFLIGSIDALNPVVKTLQVSRRIIIVGWVGLVALLLGIGNEYAQAVEADTLLRTEASRIGVSKKTTPPPHLELLDQLSAQFQFRFVDFSPNMNEGQLVMMERVARRYATLPVLTDFAYAKMVNGDKLESERYLDVACAIYGKDICERDMDTWLLRKGIAAGRLDIYAAPLAHKSNFPSGSSASK